MTTYLTYPHATLYLRTDKPLPRLHIKNVKELLNVLKEYTGYHYFFRAHEFDFKVSFEEALAIALAAITGSEGIIEKYPRDGEESPLYNGGLMRSILYTLELPNFS